MKIKFTNCIAISFVSLFAFSTSIVFAQTNKTSSPTRVKADTITLRQPRLVTLIPSTTNKTKMDTVVLKPTKEVEVTMEIPAIKGSLVHIVNSSRNLDIKTWPENKVKVISTVTVEEGSKVGPGMEMFEKSGVTLRSTSNRIELNSRGTSTALVHGGTMVRDGSVYYVDVTSPSNKTTTTRAISQTTGYTSKKRVLTVYVPEGSKLNIDNKSSDVKLRNNFKDAKFNISSTNLDCQNINDLELVAKYSMVNVGDVDDATIEFENGTLRANNIKNLDIDSKSSTIEYENGNNVYMRSQRDNITIESIKTVEGRKLYGELRIDKLFTNLNIEGTNADIRVRNLMPEVEKVKLNDKYADIRLPIKSLQNYTVAFEGNHSTVFAPFEKVEVKNAKAEEVVIEGTRTSGVSVPVNPTTPGSGGSSTRSTSPMPGQSSQSIYATATMGERSPSRFTAAVGDAKLKSTKFEIVCHSCTIDFK